MTRDNNHIDTRNYIQHSSDNKIEIIFNPRYCGMQMQPSVEEDERHTEFEDFQLTIRKQKKREKNFPQYKNCWKK